MRTIFCLGFLLTTAWSCSFGADAKPETVSPAGQTRVSLVDGKWHINGQVTYPGTKAEGLLMNVRMVNSTFEDRSRPEFDVEANTAAFLAQIPSYAAHGVRAFTLCLQGGMPGYEGAVNSAFAPDGSLRQEYMDRIRRVIDACDRQGIIVILGCYYQRQSAVLQDENAVRAGLVNVVQWIRDNGLTNVVLETANEYPHKGFVHQVLRSPQGQAALLRLAKQTWPQLLVSASGYGDGKLHAPVAEAGDFLLIHFNGTPVEEIPARIAALRKYGKPIVCNEDDKTGQTAARAAELCVENGASWGLMLNQLNQYQPFTFQGADDDPVVYARLRALTTPSKPEPQRQATGMKLLPSDVDWDHPVYQTDFDKPADLEDWRLEGGLQMSIAGGNLVLESRPGSTKSEADANHLVCWLTKEMPADFLLEFSVRPENRQQGLNIVFFNTRGLHGETIFDPALAPRDGLFKQYHSGDLNGYHISYWAAGRGTANVRKNRGFHLVAEGTDLVTEAPAGAFQTVRLYKHGGTIRCTVDDALSVAYDDDGTTFGPVWTHTGWIGLRQMGHTVRCQYGHLKVWPLMSDK